jgi:hypothetical protein
MALEDIRGVGKKDARRVERREKTFNLSCLSWLSSAIMDEPEEQAPGHPPHQTVLDEMRTNLMVPSSARQLAAFWPLFWYWAGRPRWSPEIFRAYF